MLNQCLENIGEGLLHACVFPVVMLVCVFIYRTMICKCIVASIHIYYDQDIAK